MSVFKCKMCGGNIEFNPGDTVGVCDSCGTKQTLPRLDDDRKANLYDRANHFRRNNEFDKAAGIYENILNEDSADAEAYWSLVLCRYGIEYVEDPATHRRVPTVNRAQYTSVFDDDNYKSALHYADGAQRELYQSEAAAINEIQKGILEISQREEPFDIFICYKETDASGRRTRDSVLANDLYHQLTQEGFKVFFSRITLEDKLGTAYEPYIFAALNSAKVMVVLGTKPEYFNAVWVKNEWSRYLALIKNGAKKVLIPAYRDMDPYDLPEEFSHLQAQDMSKLGFMQDLIRGVKKIVGADSLKTGVREVVPAAAGSASTAPLLKRAFMFLEDGEWQEAYNYCEKVLDLDPECAEAYLGKLMAQERASVRDDLANCKNPFNGNDNYRKVMRFGDEKLAAELEGYIAHINERNEHDRLEGIYGKAEKAMNGANTEAQFKEAAKLFDSISEYRDAKELHARCLEKAEDARKDAIYYSAKKEAEKDDINSCRSALKTFQSIINWRDSEAQISACMAKIERLKEEAERQRLEQERRAEEERLEQERRAEEKRIARERRKKKAKKMSIIASSLACVVLVLGLLTKFLFLPMYYIDKFGEERYNMVKSLKVGDTYTFGTYEQDNNTANGKEEIEWIVLDKKGMSVLLISKYALDCQPYNSSFVDVTWETSSMRQWLNETFLNTAFSSEEQNSIISSVVKADENIEYSTSPGNDTTDKVFLLSIQEASKYFSSDDERKCAPTKYAISNGAAVSIKCTVGDAATCWWWLRSHGGTEHDVVVIRDGGEVSEYGSSVTRLDNAVRPAMWISFE